MGAANYILGLEDGKNRFLDAVFAMNKSYSLCGTLDEAGTLHKEVAQGFAWVVFDMLMQSEKVPNNQ